MQHATYLRTVRAAAWLLGLALLVGCSSGGSDGEAACAEPFSTGLSGTWVVTEMFASNQPTCAGTGQYDVDLVQQGNQLAWQRADFGTAYLTLCGRVITVPAEARPLDEGLVMTIRSHGALFDSEDHFTATANFSIVVGANGAAVCGGEVFIEGSRK